MTRIAFVCTDPGIPVFGTKGASVHAQAVLQVLIRAGHEVHVITPRPGPIADHPIGAQVRLHQLPEIGRGPAAEREQAAIHSDRQVAAVLEAVRPEVVYERYALWGRTATAWARMHAVPSILEVNAPLPAEQAAYRELINTDGAIRVARAAIGAATAVVCVSGPVADWARTMSGRPEAIMVLPNGVDTDRIYPGTSPQAAADEPCTVGFVGTLKAWHGVEFMIDALSRVEGSGWRLLVVGDGPMRAELTERAAAAGVDAEFTGAVAPEQIVDQLHRMDLACAPYPGTGDHYFSPLKVYEYLAAGLPVVASSIGQIPDILDHGRLGRLVTPGDIDDLAAALHRLRSDRTERLRLAGAGRQAALTRHTWTGVVERAFAAVDLTLEGVPTSADLIMAGMVD
jgi:glycosyltransferase involved in cell wall biosynthesis